MQYKFLFSDEYFVLLYILLHSMVFPLICWIRLLMSRAAPELWFSVSVCENVCYRESPSAVWSCQVYCQHQIRYLSSGWSLAFIFQHKSNILVSCSNSSIPNTSYFSQQLTTKKMPFLFQYICVFITLVSITHVQSQRQKNLRFGRQNTDLQQAPLGNMISIKASMYLKQTFAFPFSSLCTGR